MDKNDVMLGLILVLGVIGLATCVSSCMDRQSYRRMEACKAFLASDASAEAKSRSIEIGGACRVGQ